VALYVRVSLDEDRQRFSIPAQIDRLQAHCKGIYGDAWVLHETFRDTESGSSHKRPGLAALVEDAQAGAFDVLVVLKIDRLYRNVRGLATIAEQLLDCGVPIVSASEPFDTATPAGRAMLQIVGVMAEWEREQIIERTSLAMRKKAKGGAWCGGKPPLGYGAVNGMLVINEQEADHVRGVFRLHRRMGSILAVVEEVNRRHLRTRAGRPFTKESVRRMLISPVYAGRITFGGETHEGNHTAIVPVEEWEATQRMLKHGPGQKQGRNPTALLSGILKCAKCGSPMTFHQSTKGKRRYAYYVCRRVREEGASACPGSRVAADVVEAQVVDRIRAVAKDKLLVEATYRATLRELEARRSEVEAEIARLEGEKTRLEGERRNVLDAIASGGGGRDALVAKLGEIDVKIVETEGKVAAAKDELRRLEDAVVEQEDVKAILDGFDELWDALWPEERRRVVGLLVSEAGYDPGTGNVSTTTSRSLIRTASP
jgi:site-specific DNA recombinase